MKIRAILCDFGGVLYRTPNPWWLPLLNRLLGVRDKKMLSLLSSSPLDSSLMMDIMTGKIAESDIWNEFAQVWRMGPVQLRRLRQRAASPKRLNISLLNHLNDLRARYKVGILTNAGSDFREMFCSPYRLDDYVDRVIISAEEGLIKPHKAIYDLAARLFSVDLGETLLIDDMAENITGARQAGMRAIHYTSYPQLQVDLQQALEEG